MSGRLAGRAALVTGAGSGIGAAAALRFAEEGAAVAVLDVRAEAAADVTIQITRRDGRALALAADVTKAKQVDEAVGRAVAEFGHLDVLYNNAGAVGRGSVTDTAEDDWERTFAVNVTGTFLCSRAALRYMAPAEGDSASIINQASVAALVGVANLAAYCAAKGAVVSLTRSMAVDLAPRRVRVNVICPGTVYTPLIEPLLRARGDGDVQLGRARTVAKYPIGRLGTPGEIADVAMFLAGAESSFLTGAVIAADGGMTAQ